MFALTFAQVYYSCISLIASAGSLALAQVTSILTVHPTRCNYGSTKHMLTLDDRCCDATEVDLVKAPFRAGPDDLALASEARASALQERDGHKEKAAPFPERPYSCDIWHRPGGASRVESVFELALIQIAVVLDPRDSKALHAGTVHGPLP